MTPLIIGVLAFLAGWCSGRWSGVRSTEKMFQTDQSRGLAVFLAKLFKAGVPTKTDTLGLTYSQRTNSQKLRYWGLAKQALNEESVIKRGWWEITDKGKQFVAERIRIPKFAVTRDNVVLRLEGPEINFKEACDGWEYYRDYAAQASAQVRREFEMELDL